MKLTTKGRFAVTAMMQIALKNNDGPTSLANISKKHDISLSYLEQLFVLLRKNNLVKSVRGPGGGYLVSKPLNQISIAHIIQSVESNFDATACGGQKNCRNKSEPCMTHFLWENFSKHMMEYLNRISLQELVEIKSPTEKLIQFIK